MIKKPRVLLYSHDTYGLGHLRRTLSIAQQLYDDVANIHQLVVTGSMVAGAFALPPRLDLVKLPALSKRSSGQMKARALPLTLRQTLGWREQMILQAVKSFGPHLVLVDKVAGGVHGELLPALRFLKSWSPATQIVLGMRDIEDSPSATRAEWARNQTLPLMEQVYDQLLLYGQREVFDPIQAYAMSPIAAAKVVPCGYLRRGQVRRSEEDVRRELAAESRPLVVVTVGGGGDGFDVIKAYLDMLGLVEGGSYHSLIVTGPLMAASKRAWLGRMTQGLSVTWMEFTPDLLSYLAAADVVVSMAGYNTVCELLSLGKRAVLVPRVQVRAEQRIRAEALASRGIAQVVLPTELTPQRLAGAIQQALAAPPPHHSLDLDGLRRISQSIQDLLGQSQPDSIACFQPAASIPYLEKAAA